MEDRCRLRLAAVFYFCAATSHVADVLSKDNISAYISQMPSEKAMNIPISLK